MPRCNHQNLILLNTQDQKLRCRHCHLTICEGELAQGYCPECYEVSGVRRRDFEQCEPEDNGEARYRCEECGIIITC